MHARLHQCWSYVVTSDRSLLSFFGDVAPDAKSQPPEWLFNLILGGMLLLVILVSVLIARKLAKPGEIPLAPGERIERNFPANRWMGIVNAGGWLRVTNQRLVFVAHGLNVGDKKPLSLPWHEITRVGYGMSGKELAVQTAAELLQGSVDSSTLVVEHVNGAERFAVYESPELIECLESHIQQSRVQAAGSEVT